MAVPEFVSHAASWWSSLYGNSRPITTLVTYAHLGALLVGGGAAVDADQQVLRARNREEAKRAASVTRMQSVHRTVIGALVLVALSGFLMFAADAATFVGSKVFWFKMALVALLLVNGTFLLRAEKAVLQESLARPWSRLRLASALSLCLWAAVLLAGILLRTAA